METATITLSKDDALILFFAIDNTKWEGKIINLVGETKSKIIAVLEKLNPKKEEVK